MGVVAGLWESAMVHIGTYCKAIAPGHMIITHCVNYVKHVDTVRLSALTYGVHVWFLK